MRGARTAFRALMAAVARLVGGGDAGAVGEHVVPQAALAVWAALAGHVSDVEDESGSKEGVAAARRAVEARLGRITTPAWNSAVSHWRSLASFRHAKGLGALDTSALDDDDALGVDGDASVESICAGTPEFDAVRSGALLLSAAASSEPEEDDAVAVAAAAEERDEEELFFDGARERQRKHSSSASSAGASDGTRPGTAASVSSTSLSDADSAAPGPSNALAATAAEIASEPLGARIGKRSGRAPSGGEESKGAESIDARWLLVRCQQHLAMAGAATGFSPADLACKVLEAVRKRSGDAEVQSSLYELLGDGGFELMATLIQNREALRRVSLKQLRTLARAAETVNEGGLRRPTGHSGPANLGVTVQTAAEKELAKMQRKQAKKAAKARHAGGDTLAGLGFDESYLEQERALGLQGGVTPAAAPAGGAHGSGAGREGDIIEHIAEQASGGAGGLFTPRALPQGTTRTQIKDERCEEVDIPPPERPPGASKARLAISTLPDYARLAFKGTKSLNELQTQLFPAAFKSSENLLVCAPTGAGKTNVAMLSVLREIGQHFVHGVLQKNDYKIVYVAPMKALAAEVVAKFGAKLKPLGVSVRELTGDMQLTKREIAKTQMIVTTPEKWDVITRKAGEGTLVADVRLLIIDEVHLLADDRGAVIESIVARTLRHVETSQSMVRIVGLSATLPNYEDVALFLRVNPRRGLFHFGDAYRPVPLRQTFIGVSERNQYKMVDYMNRIAWRQAASALRRGKQVMVFVHSRKDTGKTARALLDVAAENGQEGLISPYADGDVETAGGPEGPSRSLLSSLKQQVSRSRNVELRELFDRGIGIHHAGMLRSDRSLTERAFAAGALKVLCCTATLAWGVNLPAHMVVIKGTKVYNAEAGGFMNLSMLDVMQIFGRAGRPQFDTSGHGVIITSHEDLSHYLGLLLRQKSIESNFIKALPDQLNAEIVAGTVVNVAEACVWLSYTYLYIRMMRNSMSYGITPAMRAEDPLLEEHRRQLIEQAAEQLDECRMIRFHRASGNFAVTDPGRVASHYYIRSESIRTFNELIEPMLAGRCTDDRILNLVCHAEEFDNIRVRDEELSELDRLKRHCPIELRDAVENKHGKICVLLQTYISGVRPTSFTLISDMSYVTQSAGRIARGLFEIALRRGWCYLAERLLTLSKSIDKRVWWTSSPLRQFSSLSWEALNKLEDAYSDLDRLRELDAAEIGSIIRHPRDGQRVASLIASIPKLYIEVTSIQPITRGILRVTLNISPDFTWVDRQHGSVEPWWIWVEDSNSETIYHSEYFLLNKKQALSGEPVPLIFTVPLFDPLPPQYWIRACSDRWLDGETTVEVPFRQLRLPDRAQHHTDLLDLQPLPVGALQNAAYEALYAGKFTHFNPVQTQMFHTLYHTDVPVLLGAPTGSGKTVAAELSVMRLFEAHPRMKAVYVAPLKALVSERVRDWKVKFGEKLGRRIVELTGDATPDARSLASADILVTTPEKWDAVSRAWRVGASSRSAKAYIGRVGLVILDEVHLLGEDRGPVLEVIVSRMRRIAAATGAGLRFVALSTALANASDLADWLGIAPAPPGASGRLGLYNFRPNVRPIPMDVHIQGFPGKHYCPRMATMNKPTYAAIQTYSPDKPTLVFVASRRQTRLTALELIALCARDENPKQWVGISDEEMEAALATVRDDSLRHCLAFGVGIHHAGLAPSDRELSERLFLSGGINVLVCTATLAWGVNLPAHLVVVKGTEYFDGRLGRYVDFAVTDVLQMMGRAGRPQYDTHGVALILVHEPKKNFYRKFLYEPFPVESQLKARNALHDALNAEIAGAAISNRADAAEYLTWTYFFRRLCANPSYYDCEDGSTEGIRAYLSELIDTVLGDLEDAGCISVRAEDDGASAGAGARSASGGAGGDADDGSSGPEVAPTMLGHVASYYYMSYRTMSTFRERLRGDLSPEEVALVFADAAEFEEMPVRHNEDELNKQLATVLPWAVPRGRGMELPSTKTFLLLQAHMCRVPLPISDYNNDTKTMLDQAARVLNAIVDVAADARAAGTVRSAMQLSQCLVAGRLPTDPDLAVLPHAGDRALRALERAGVTSVAQLLPLLEDEGRGGGKRGGGESKGVARVRRALGRTLKASQVDAFLAAARRLPQLQLRYRVAPDSDDAATPPEGRGAKEPGQYGGAPRVAPGASLRLDVTVRVLNARSASDKPPSSRFSKADRIGWWLLLSTADGADVLALKRIHVRHSRTEPATFSLKFSAPAGGGAGGAGGSGGALRVSLSLASDAVRGLDQQHDVELALAE